MKAPLFEQHMSLFLFSSISLRFWLYGVTMYVPVNFWLGFDYYISNCRDNLRLWVILVNICLLRGIIYLFIYSISDKELAQKTSDPLSI